MIKSITKTIISERNEVPVKATQEEYIECALATLKEQGKLTFYRASDKRGITLLTQKDDVHMRFEGVDPDEIQKVVQERGLKARFLYNASAEDARARRFQMLLS